MGRISNSAGKGKIETKSSYLTNSKIFKWFGDRIDLDGILEFMYHKTVPHHKFSIWYYFGGISLYLFLVQVITGILLLLYYKPTAESAYESVQYIVTQVPFGWLVRSIHSWAANLFIFFAFVHMFSVFLMKAYRKPRELTWISGIALLFLAMGFGFSGYLLPWNQLAYLATNVGTNFAGMVPFIGQWLLEFLRGGPEVTAATLTRFFGFHIAILPGITTIIITIHLVFVQRMGMSTPISIEKQIAEGKTRKIEIPFFPNFILRDIMAWTLALGLLVLLASLFPWELGEKADILKPAPPHIRPEWYFVFMYQTLKYVPKLLGVLGFALAGFIWVFLPFLDKKSNLGQRNRLYTIIGVVVIIYMVVLTLIGYFAPGE
ncbi:MAG: cytochrome bc complex cytochrome b subunit [candidate division Zixibacteria bacterium]|nr:cytochrome bc complex cytochrome b subunit [candidate division Zixibacteria bacterium]